MDNPNIFQNPGLLQASRAGSFFRSLLTNVLDELLDQVDGIPLSKFEKVKQSLRNISHNYRMCLSQPYSLFRSDWDDSANRCAYVFLYFIHHCYLVYISLHQYLPEISTNWQYKDLKVCSIGGGPGSDLVGLTRFLDDNNIIRILNPVSCLGFVSQLAKYLGHNLQTSTQNLQSVLPEMRPCQRQRASS